ncbi:MAG: hypothetical protein MK098_05180 [Marinovum sp.]|nr:hypothetical protein [Marinovum sp.]
MDTDLALIIGLALGLLSVPSVISAICEARAPRVAALTLLIGGGLVIYALNTHPGGYELSDIPDVFYKVVARYMP